MKTVALIRCFTHNIQEVLSMFFLYDPLGLYEHSRPCNTLSCSIHLNKILPYGKNVKASKSWLCSSFKTGFKR